MFDKEALLKTLDKLSFPKKEYWVVAGGAMVLHGFRSQTKDIDIGCTTHLADVLQQQGYKTIWLDDGTRRIEYSKQIEIFENWLEDKAILVNNVPVVSVEGLIHMKRKLGRKKDIEDIQLIERLKKN